MTPENKPSFTNEASRRFWRFYMDRMEAGDLSRKQIAADFGFKQAYSYSFWENLASGKTTVDTEHIEIGRQKHGLNPLYVLGYSPEPVIGEHTDTMMLEEPSVAYGIKEDEELSIAIGGRIDELLDKHQVKRGQYAEERLEMSPRNLQRIIQGASNITVSTLFKIAEDLNESLDIFRPKPLAKGHYLTLLKEREERIQEQSNTIRMYERMFAGGSRA